METRRYKTHAAVGGSRWETGSTLAMLQAMPSMLWCLDYYRVVPPLHLVNERLATGLDDAGMSGKCEWQPFALSEGEYEEIVEELVTSPQFQCELDAELSGIDTFAKWNKAVQTKYQESARDRQ